MYNYADSFGDMLEKGIAWLMVVLAVIGAASLVGIIMMIRSEKKAAQEGRKSPLIKRILGYYFLSMLFLGVVFLFEGSLLARQNNDLPLREKDINAMVTAGNAVGYILMLVGGIKAARQSGRGEHISVKPIVQLILGALLFAAAIAASAMISLI